jgi:aspartyl-tRNA(Asn)/glutamyl-tRNA(Gln) amidotransferase subunit A
MMNAISGYDPHDSTSVPEKTDDYTVFCKKGLKDLTVGIPKEYVEANGIDPDVARSVKQAIKTIEALGAVCRQVSLPHSEHAVASYYIISSAEASSNLARYDGVKYGLRNKDKNSLVEMYESTRSSGFGSEVVRRIIIGTYALSAGYYDAYYKKALQVRTLIMEDFSKAFDVCDIIISPVAPTPAFKIGEKIDDPLKMYLSDVFTLSANLVGIPGMSIPCGFSSKGLPIGLQLIGKHFEEGKLFKLAYNFEQATDFHKQKPLL